MYHLNIISKTKIWYTISGALILISIVSLLIFNLNLGIDFTGGSMLDIEFNEVNRPTINEIELALEDFNLSNLKIQPIGEKGLIIRMPDIDEETHQAILSTLNEKFTPMETSGEENNSEEVKDNNEIPEINLDATQVGADGEVVLDMNNSDITTETVKTKTVEEKRFNSIGPVIGQELKDKSLWAMLIVLIAIVLYIAYVFRKISKPVESWKYGISAIIALAHDVIIILGIFSVLGYFMGAEIDAFFISALLTILGFSVNDTIVTFDRVRENLHKKQHLTFKELINISINETITRSINTSLTTFVVLLSVFIFGGETIRFFVLALILGVVIGTYSSIFIASPLLLFWYNKKYN
jgi:preprotein translocase subunit SecF